ncbi:MAG: hypothetical protein WBD22_05670 [Pyrinomonadaceae bacterium]
MTDQTKLSPNSWLAFELNVLRRLEFKSVAFPLTPTSALGRNLKWWGVRVLANDPYRANWADALSSIFNNSNELSPDEVSAVLADAYVPRYRLQNPSLTNWFNESDSWWFDNVRQNIDSLETPISRVIAASISMAAGNCVMSFTDDTLELRQPLSDVFRRIAAALPDPIDNGQDNVCENRSADEFIAQSDADLLFLRLPPAHRQSTRFLQGRGTWREEWIRGESGFWSDFDSSQLGRLGSPTESKSQYLNLLEQTLNGGSGFPKWAVAHVEDGFVSTQDIVDTISRLRKVETVYTKDFSELTGTKAIVITA